MKSNKSYLLALLLAACTTTSTARRQDLSPSTFDSVVACSGAKCVESILGKPSEKEIKKDRADREFWFYMDQNKSQRGAIEIKRDDQKVVAVLVIPRESDSEFKLSYLLKNRFSNSAFEKVPL